MKGQSDPSEPPPDPDPAKPPAQDPASPPPTRRPPRAAPNVPHDAKVDLPPVGDERSDLVAVDDPEGDHRRGMDRYKLRFAIWLISCCVGFVVLLSCFQFFFQQRFSDAATLNNAIDLMKLLATTALGFVFGRSLDKGDSQ